MKKLILLTFCALSMLTASAQRAISSSSSTIFSTEKTDEGVTFGIRGGLNSAVINVSNDHGSSYTTDSRLAWHVGVIADIPLMESLYFQTGLFFQNKGGQEEDEEGKYTMKPMYLEVPVLASYRYNFSDDAQLQLNVGPYFAYGIGGKEVEEEHNGKEYEEDFFDDYTNKFDAGLQLGAGMTFMKTFYVGVAYQLGFSNILKHSDDYSMKNRNWMFSVGYNF